MACNNTSSFEKIPFKLPFDVQCILGVDLFVIVIALLLNFLGILVLLRRKLKNISPQNILIIHMSFVSIINIFTNATAVYWKYHGSRFTNAFIVVYYFAHMAYILNLCLLSLDRFMFVAFPFRYRTKMTKVIVFSCLCVLWLLSIILGLLIEYGDIANEWFRQNASYVYNGFVIAFSICIYTFIVVRTYHSSLINSNHLLIKKMKKLFIMPFLIVFTFFLFVFLPHLIAYNVQIKSKNTRKLLLLALIGINVLNNVSDPIIYMYLQPAARKKLLLFIRKFKAFLTGRKLNLFPSIFGIYYHRKNKDESFTSCTATLEVNFETITPGFANQTQIVKPSEAQDTNLT